MLKKLALITMRGDGLSIAFGNPKKLASVTMRGDGLSIAFGNPKKTLANSTCLAREASLKLHCVPTLRKRTLVP